MRRRNSVKMDGKLLLKSLSQIINLIGRKNYITKVINMAQQNKVGIN